MEYGICLGVILVLVIMLVISANTQYETQTATVFFASYEIEDKKLNLYTVGDENAYVVSAYRTCITEPQLFLMACKTGMRFQIRYEIRDDWYSLCSITGENGIEYLTEDAVRANRNGDQAIGYWFIGAVFAVVCLWMLGTVYVGRHPEKFSKKVIRLFFRDGYIRDVSKTT